ncbi:MAG: hypothetical protein LBS66_01865 [Rhodospirillaceae bacterium]|nr:hypothetical protein [Rhodospirillaceae bacterium]
MQTFYNDRKRNSCAIDLPKKIVIFGPYCHVRNPMITSVFIMQIAESLLLNSLYVFALFVMFFGW